MSTYAAGTTVPVDRTRGEIERVLKKYGADQFAYAEEPGRALIGFRMSGFVVRMALPLPAPPDPKRATAKAVKLCQQQTRQRWRCLLLIVKARLEAVASGVTSFEDTWLAHLVVPGTGLTVGERVLPQLQDAWRDGTTPTLLLGCSP